MIIYGVLGDVSILKLFTAGVLPGLLQPAGRDWREFRNVTLRWIGGIAILAVEQNVSGLDQVGEVGLVVRHPDDAPLSLQAAAPRSLGRRIRL